MTFFACSPLHTFSWRQFLLLALAFEFQSRHLFINFLNFSILEFFFFACSPLFTHFHGGFLLLALAFELSLDISKFF